MKYVIYTLAALLCLSCSSNRRTRKAENPCFLQLQGTVSLTGDHPGAIAPALDSVIILVFEPSRNNLDVNYADGSGKCDFRLPFDREFLVYFCRKGFVSKIIEVNTTVPEKCKTSFAFLFDIDIFRKVEGLDASVLARPVAKIFFDPAIPGFTYNASYTDKVNEELNTMYAGYYTLRAREDSLSRIPRAPVAEAFWSAPVSPAPRPATGPADLDSAGAGPGSRDTIYSVQVCSVIFGPLPYNAPIFSGCGPANEYVENGMFKYTIGSFPTNEAAQAMLEQLQEKGYADAFIVAFRNGRRVMIPGK